MSVSGLWTDADVSYPIDVESYTSAHHCPKGKADPVFRTRLQLAVGLAQRAKASGMTAPPTDPTRPAVQRPGSRAGKISASPARLPPRPGVSRPKALRIVWAWLEPWLMLYASGGRGRRCPRRAHCRRCLSTSGTAAGSTSMPAVDRRRQITVRDVPVVGHGHTRRRTAFCDNDRRDAPGGDVGAIAGSWESLTTLARAEADFASAVALGEEAVTICRELDERDQYDHMLYSLSQSSYLQGDHDHGIGVDIARLPVRRRGDARAPGHDAMRR